MEKYRLLILILGFFVSVGLCFTSLKYYLEGFPPRNKFKKNNLLMAVFGLASFTATCALWAVAGHWGSDNFSFVFVSLLIAMAFVVTAIEHYFVKYVLKLFYFTLFAFAGAIIWFFLSGWTFRFLFSGNW